MKQNIKANLTHLDHIKFELFVGEFWEVNKRERIKFPQVCIWQFCLGYIKKKYDVSSNFNYFKLFVKQPEVTKKT